MLGRIYSPGCTVLQSLISRIPDVPSILSCLSDRYISAVTRPRRPLVTADLFIPPLDGSTIEHIVGTGSQLGPAPLQASSSVDRSHGPPSSAAESVDSP